VNQQAAAVCIAAIHQEDAPQRILNLTNLLKETRRAATSQFAGMDIEYNWQKFSLVSLNAASPK
jgi:hypothetical protein